MMASKLRVLMSYFDNLYGVSSVFIKVVEQHFEIVWMKDFESDPNKYQDIIAIIAWAGPTINKELLDKLPNLKIVAAVSVGYNHLDIPLIRSYGVKLSHTPDVLSYAVAEMGMTLMLSTARNLIRFVDEYRSPGYRKCPVNDMTPQVSGSTLGIVGMGRIGYIFAKQARGFNMKILYHNRSRKSAEEEQAVSATYCSSLDEMLPQCDFVVVVVSLTPETKHIMGAKQFQLMKKSAILINISRGPTINQDELVTALKSGEIYGAGLDVTTPEPLPSDHDLFKIPNVVLSPHIGSQTTVTRTEMVKLAVDNALAAVQGRKLLTEIPF